MLKVKGIRDCKVEAVQIIARQYHMVVCRMTLRPNGGGEGRQSQ